MRLTEKDFLDAKYKRYEQQVNNCSYLLQKCIQNNEGKKYYITVYAYDMKSMNISYEWGFQPEVQFQNDCKKPSSDLDTSIRRDDDSPQSSSNDPCVSMTYLLSEDDSIQKIEDFFERAWVFMGSSYIS